MRILSSAVNQLAETGGAVLYIKQLLFLIIVLIILLIIVDRMRKKK